MMVFNKVRGSLPPKTPLSHKCSSSTVIGSAQFTFTPRPVARNLFISGSRVLLIELNMGLKKDILGRFCCTCLWIPQIIWYRVFRGYSSPVLFLASSINLGTQKLSCSFVMHWRSCVRSSPSSPMILSIAQSCHVRRAPFVASCVFGGIALCCALVYQSAFLGKANLFFFGRGCESMLCQSQLPVLLFLSKLETSCVGYFVA